MLAQLRGLKCFNQIATRTATVNLLLGVKMPKPGPSNDNRKARRASLQKIKEEREKLEEEKRQFSLASQNVSQNSEELEAAKAAAQWAKDQEMWAKEQAKASYWKMRESEQVAEDANQALQKAEWRFNEQLNWARDAEKKAKERAKDSYWKMIEMKQSAEDLQKFSQRVQWQYRETAKELAIKVGQVDTESKAKEKLKEELRKQTQAG